MASTTESIITAAAQERAASLRCRACASSRARLFSRDEHRTIYKCGDCGLLFRFPQPSPADLHTEFQLDYFKGDGVASRLELEFESWRRPVLAQITDVIKHVKPKGKLLDVGCASGELFEFFLNGEWNLCGVEPSQVAVARARERFAAHAQVRLFHGYLSDVPAQESWDVIAILESLFYMPDPQKELASVCQLLETDGLLVIATPGYQYQCLRHTGLFSRIVYGRQCSLTSSHLYYFSERALAELLRSSGFRIMRVVPLGSSTYGSGLGRTARNLYVMVSRFLSFLTLGRV